MRFGFLLLIVIVSTATRAPLAHGDDEARADSLAAAPSAERLGLIAPDKLQHASLSFASGLAVGLVTREPGAAAGGALTLGVAKELWDMHRTHFDRGDLLADALGAALAAWATHALRR